VIFTRK